MLVLNLSLFVFFCSNSAHRLRALFVEPFHKIEAMKFVIRNALDMLPPNWTIIVVMPEKPIRMLQEHFCSQECDRLDFRVLPPQNWSIDIYSAGHWRNLMFTTPDMWQTLGADYVLTLQADSLICDKRVPDLRYNYIGGPRAALDNGSVPVPSAQYDGRMNGGAALRRVSWVLHCIHRHPQWFAAEDALFQLCTREDKQTVTYGEAMAFASNNAFTGCFKWSVVDGTPEVCPHIVHKPWGINSRTSTYHQLVLHCPAIKQLELLQSAN